MILNQVVSDFKIKNLKHFTWLGTSKICADRWKSGDFDICWTCATDHWLVENVDAWSGNNSGTRNFWQKTDLFMYRYRDGSAWSCTWKLDFGFYKFHHEDLLAWSFSKIRFCDAWKSNFRYLICHYLWQDLVYLAAFSYKDT